MKSINFFYAAKYLFNVLLVIRFCIDRLLFSDLILYYFKMESCIKNGQNVLIVWQKTLPEELMKKSLDQVKNIVENGIVQLENDQRLNLGKFNVYVQLENYQRLNFSK